MSLRESALLMPCEEGMPHNPALPAEGLLLSCHSIAFQQRLHLLSTFFGEAG
jgi:hypothetical protein